MTNRLKGNLLVAGQFILLALLIFYPASDFSYGSLSFLAASIQLIGLFAGFVILSVAMIGLGKALTAHPMPNSQGELKTTGLYRYVRHPIYSGLILIAISLTLAGGLFPHSLFLVALVILLNYKARFEEALLAQRYSGYKEYSLRTGRFLPRLKG